MTVIEIAGSTVTANDYWSTTTKRPKLDSHNDIALLAWDTDGSSFVRAKF